MTSARVSVRCHRRGGRIPGGVLGVAAAAAVAVLLAAAPPAGATVTEPSGLMVPRPLSMNEIQAAAGANIRFPNVSLDILFKSRGDNALNWMADAQKKPDTFQPACGFTAQLVLRGGGCRIDFGW